MVAVWVQDPTATVLVKGMGRTVPVENLPWPIVEHRLHPLNQRRREFYHTTCG
jgi:hypothetical protein